MKIYRVEDKEGLGPYMTSPTSVTIHHYPKVTKDVEKLLIYIS